MIGSIQVWAEVWKWIFLSGCTAFLLLALYTIVVGALDIRQLFRSLREKQEEEPEDY